MKFLDGRLGNVQTVAFVPGEFGARIGAYSPDLRLELQYARKLQQKHRLRYEHFLMIQQTIDFGYVGIDRGRNLVFLYVDEEIFHTSFRLVVKTAANGGEIWLKTFHRSNPQQLRATLKRMEVLREHHP